MENRADDKMSSPRFKPRRCASAPHMFGVTEQIEWNEDARSDYERDRLAAAKLQHQFAVIIRAKAKTKFKSVAKYAEAAGVPYDRIGKVLRGEAIMRLEDIAQAERLLGVILPGLETVAAGRKDAAGP